MEVQLPRVKTDYINEDYHDINKEQQEDKEEQQDIGVNRKQGVQENILEWRKSEPDVYFNQEQENYLYTQEDSFEVQRLNSQQQLDIINNQQS